MGKKITLDAEQLKYLMEYIASKGFPDPILRMELLDHFACKVEDTMSAYPFLDFHQAVKKAHLSYGVMGFRSAELGVQESIMSEWKLFSKTQWKELFSSGKIVLVALLSIAAGAITFYWQKINYVIWEYANLSQILVVLIYLSLLIAFAKSWKFSKNYYCQTVNANTWLSFWPFYFLVLFNPPKNEKYFVIYSIYIALNIFWGILQTMFRYRYYQFIKSKTSLFESGYRAIMG